MVDGLGPLSARPPTPPRTASRLLSEKDRMGDSPATVQTPIDSPYLPSDSTGAPSSRQSKRVNFSPWPKYIKPPSFSNTKSKALLPSNELKPTRSILKLTNSPGPVSFAGVISYTPESFAMLLESITQQLAGESISSRVDAYMQFFGALRAYEKLPTEEEIVRKLGLITQFIQRDISRDLAKGGPLDTNLVIHALKLSVVLVWHPQISAQLPDEFKLFLVEHSVSCLEDGVKLPKSVITHYLSVLSTQKFQARIITQARIIRILEMLHGLTDRVKGNSVVSQRLMIYERLFELSKPAFVSQSTSWMDHLISGLLHQIRDIRLKAIELGFNTYVASGSNPLLSKVLRDIFDRPLPNKRKMISEICERMSRMMANPETGEHVPQIWGVITLLLRSKRFNIDQWQHFKDWVLVLQKCFNCSDSEIKSKAIGNWNRFVLVANISETTSRSLLRMLSKPILSQFERKKQEKQSSRPSQLVIASYYNLLYYAFRPDASHQQLDIVWEEYIASPSSNIFASVPSLSDRVAHALSNMLWSSQPFKTWSDNRVNEPKRIVAEELPPLDCKWVRSRIPAVLKVFEDILKSSIWEPQMGKSNIAVSWVNLSHALAFAANKEITPSQESMQAVAHVLGLLQRLWNAGPLALNAVRDDSKDTFFDRFRFLSTTMIVALGTIPFTEKLLLKTAEATYQAANTPTHRHSKSTNNPDSPILHLLRLTSDVSGISGPTTSYSRLINDTVEAACHGRVSRGSRLDILRQCADLYPRGHEFHFGVENFAQIVWNSTAQLSTDCLCSFPIESARERDGSVSRDYENVVKILSAGLKFSDISSIWDRLLDAFTRVLRTERGDYTLVNMVLEPLAASMMVLSVHNTYLPASSIFNHSLSISFSDYDDAATGEADNKVPSFPLGLVGLAHRILNESYERFEPSKLNEVAVFIESLISFLGSGVASFRSILLSKLQEPLCLYLKDASHKISVESGVESRILTACHALSTALLNILQILPHDAMTLEKFEHILCSGLGSSHISTATRFGDFWNSTFGTQLQPYPEAISQALREFETKINCQTADSVPVKDPRPPQHDSIIELNKDGVAMKDLAMESVGLTPKDVSVNSHIAFILDAPQESFSARLDSSPMAKGPESAAPALQQTREPAPQALSDALSHSTNREGFASPLPKEDITRHSEVFSMIDNLRSSSPPVNTPREFGFMTPPHLHTLRHVESGATTPQTPTMPAVSADNEDGFLGSSPTPAIRGRTHSVGSMIPSSLATADSMGLDPPSSPPELVETPSVDSRQNSPSKHLVKDRIGKNKNKRNRSKRSLLSGRVNAGMKSSQNEHNQPNSQNSAGQSFRSRLRSATDNSPAKIEDNAGQQMQEASKLMGNDARHNSIAAYTPGPKNVQKLQPELADTADSDMDTQATSQLEHDLVSSVDRSGSAADKEIIASAEQALLTRKRRRDEEAHTSTQSSKERRRSSRLYSTLPAEVEENQSARPKKQRLSTISHQTPSSPANSAKKRKPEIVDLVAKSPKRDQAKQGKDARKSLDAQESSQKRRSFRISGHAAADIPEDNPVPKKSPRSTDSRKPNKKQKSGMEKKVQSQTVEEASPNEATTMGEIQVMLDDAGSSSTNKGFEQQPELRISSQPNHSTLSIQDAETPDEHDAPVAEAQETIQTEAEIEPEPTSLVSQNFEIGTEPQQHPEPTQTDPALVSAGAELQQEQEKDAEPKPTSKRSLDSDNQITTSLRTLLDHVKSASLGRDTVKELDDILFDLRFEMHEALRRHRETAAAPPTD